MSMLLELFSYSFITRAVIVGILVSLCAALLGVILVLKRYSMIGDGLSHVGFGALSIAMVTNTSPLFVSIPVVVAAAFILLSISQNSKIKGDSAIAIISSTSMAIGICATTVRKGFNLDVHNYMFGSIMAMSKADLYISVILSVIVLASYILFYNKLFKITFDESFAVSASMNVGLYKSLIAILTAITIVIGMRIMGTLLISSLIVFPTLSSMRVFKSFRPVVISAAVISVVCFFFGIIVSFVFGLPTGASIVLVNLILFLIFYAIGHVSKL